MDKTEIIEKTVGFVKSKMEGDSSGHDWWHIYRVWNNSKMLHKKEGGDLFVIELAALLHDVADWKFNSSEHLGIKIVDDWLNSLGLDKSTCVRVIDIIKNISFKGAGVEDKMESIEGKIVQDADRLDAIGAVGIGRTFAFGGKFGNEMYNPEVPVVMHDSFEKYKNSKGTTINHFYEKLLLLKDRMNTPTAKKIAEGRHRFMKQFLQQFMDEWRCKQ
ncbi:MAG TPA: HD domain-containing protein [Bacteroidales bacterium]|nr:HD domain-containing protein [Bacteroidales bacterium]